MDQSLHYNRHRFLWNLCYYPVKLYMCLRYNYRPKVRPIDGPALIVSNHVTDFDPIFLGITIRKFAYFIASEHVFRKNGKLLIWAQGTIPRLKGATAGDTALTSIRRMKKGYSVALFAEGSRNFNGVTADIFESTAKLARVSGASLVTHRFRGGYFTSPRWSGRSVRRGRFTGEVVRVIPPAELKAMTNAQVADIIREDIYEDAYATQAEWMTPYKGKNLAEHIERTLCVCPKCASLGTMESHGSSFSCRGCGLTGEYTEYGYLESAEELPFHTVLDWDRWQAQELKKRADAAGSALLAEDTDMELIEVLNDFETRAVAKGRMAMYRDRFEFSDAVIPLADVTGININGPQDLVFSAQGRHYTVLSERVRNVRKYYTLYQAITAPDKLMSL